MKYFRVGCLCLMLVACARVGSGQEDDPSLPGLEDQYSGVSREAVLKSSEWRETMIALNQWLMSQKLYSREQVSQFKRTFNARVKKMPGQEMLDCMHNVQAKLKVINSPEAREDRRWFREQLSLASDAYGQKLKSRVPDISKMSADDMQHFLDNFGVRQSEKKSAADAFAKGRDQRVQEIRRELKQTHDDEQRALDRASEDAAAAANSGPVGYGIGGYGIAPRVGFGAYRW